MKIPKQEENGEGCIYTLLPLKNEVNLLSKKIVSQKLYLEKRHLALLKAEIELMRSQGQDVRNMSQILREIVNYCGLKSAALIST